MSEQTRGNQWVGSATHCLYNSGTEMVAYMQLGRRNIKSTVVTHIVFSTETQGTWLLSEGKCSQQASLGFASWDLSSGKLPGKLPLRLGFSL